MLPGYTATCSWSVLVPRLHWWVLGLDLHMRSLSLSPDGLLECSHPIWAHSLERVSLGEPQMCLFIGGACLSLTLGASLLLCNVVNRAMSDVQVNICQYVVFISKLILSYLPVHLTDSLPSYPLSLCCRRRELNEMGE